MNILLSLKSRVLGEALQEILARAEPADKVFIDNGRHRVAGESPEIVIADQKNIKAEVLAKWGAAKVILLDTGLHQDEVVNTILLHRLPGVISIDEDLALMKKAIRVVHGGQVWINNHNLKALLCKAGTMLRGGEIESVSQREREILKHLTLGKTNREIAESLYMSEHTVKTHMTRIFRKFKVSNRAQLVTCLLDSSHRYS
ncbi:DNA-binding response regulator [Geomonas sp. Red276]